ncbi:MAG: toprim domain-containing protein, partial [Nitrososphaerota archaeon]|nr:toprim domain-containing protein [Nitrososphaerota archaeon]
GYVYIPASTDITTAALIAAAIENVDKVGPCSARFQLEEIEDVRASRRKSIEERAKDILKTWSSKATSEGEETLKSVTEAIKRGKVVSYGRDELTAGEGARTAEEIILVEGRADVINLGRAGYTNTVAIGGAKLTDSIIRLTKQKKCIAFLDGDRGGDIIARELQQTAKVHRILRAPKGREVEELTPLEIQGILGGAKPAERAPRREAPPAPKAVPAPKPAVAAKQVVTAKPDQKLAAKVSEIYPDLKDTLEGFILDDSLKVLGRIPVNGLSGSLGEYQGARHVVFDGIVTQRLVDASAKAGVSSLIGYKMQDSLKPAPGMVIQSFHSLGLA